MGIAELLFVAAALSMDAFAVGMTNGMTDPKMRLKRVLLIAAFYGGFQWLMPVVGYWASHIFSDLIGRVAPWVSFVLLACIGGKMIYDGAKEWAASRGVSADKARQKEPTMSEKKADSEKKLDVKTLTLQAVATSIDALAVGVSFLALDTQGTLCLNIWWDSLMIGGVTFLLSVGAVYIGKALGNQLADKATVVGGVVLVVIGIKILLEGLL